MAKAGAPKPKLKLTDKEQSERFKETARELEVDESGKVFEHTVGALLRPKPPK